MWPNPKCSAEFVTFTEKILNRKLNLFCSEIEVKVPRSFSFFLDFSWKKIFLERPKKINTLVSGNAGDEKSLHQGDRKKKVINLIELFK